MRSLLNILLLLAPVFAHAHIGSPNVFFEGQAGPYSVHVVIRPPAVLPGTAQVDVRAERAGGVSVLAVPRDAGAGAAPPPPVVANPVSGTHGLFHAPLWLLRRGAYSVQVRVNGPDGAGTAIVPLNSASFRPPKMSPVVGVLLIGLGVILFSGAVWLVWVSARDSARDQGIGPGPRDRTRAWLVGTFAALLFAGALQAGKVRWQTMDRAFRNYAMDKAIPINASVHTNGTLVRLRLTPGVSNTTDSTWDTLLADHGKLMHLFLLHQPDLNAFAHLHPVRRDAATFENLLPSLPDGNYALYAEITYENGLSRTLAGQVRLPATPGRVPQTALTSNMLNEVICQSPFAVSNNAAQPFALDADDSWHVNPASQSVPKRTASQLMGGLTMVMQNDQFAENVEESLRVAVFTPDGTPAPLQPYMGMRGHAVIRRSDGQVFTHLHPVGTISMAAQEVFRRADGNVPVSTNAMAYNSSVLGHEVSFPYAFPRSGDYRLWVQVRTGGRVVTGVFDVQVASR